MEQLRVVLTEMRKKMGADMNQCVEVIQAFSLLQEELRQIPQRPNANVNLTHEKVLCIRMFEIMLRFLFLVKRIHIIEVYKFPIIEIDKRFHLLEKRLKAIKSRDATDSDVVGLCLIPDIKKCKDHPLSLLMMDIEAKLVIISCTCVEVAWGSRSRDKQDVLLS